MIQEWYQGYKYSKTVLVSLQTTGHNALKDSATLQSTACNLDVKNGKSIRKISAVQYHRLSIFQSFMCHRNVSIFLIFENEIQRKSNNIGLKYKSSFVFWDIIQTWVSAVFMWWMMSIHWASCPQDLAPLPCITCLTSACSGVCNWCEPLPREVQYF